MEVTTNWIQNIGICAVITNLLGVVMYLLWMVLTKLTKNQTQLHYRLLKIMIVGYSIPLFYLLFVWYEAFYNVYIFIRESLGLDIYEGYHYREFVLSQFAEFFMVYLIISLVITICLVFKRLRVQIKRKEYMMYAYYTDEHDELLKKCKERLNLRKRVEVCYHPWVDAPCVVYYKGGYHIQLMDYDYTETNLETTFMHEMVHIRHNDYWWKKAIDTLKVLLPLCPAVYLLDKSYERYCELCCDITTCRIYKKKQDYFGTILAMLKYVNEGGSVKEALHFFSTKSEMHKRVAHMKMYENTSHYSKRVLLGIAVAAVLMMASMTTIMIKKFEQRGELASEVMELTVLDNQKSSVKETKLGLLQNDTIECLSGYEIQSLIWDCDEECNNATWADVQIPAGTTVISEEIIIDAGALICIVVGGELRNQRYTVGLLSADGELFCFEDDYILRMKVMIEETGYYKLVIVNSSEMVLVTDGSIRVRGEDP